MILFVRANSKPEGRKAEAYGVPSNGRYRLCLYFTVWRLA